MDSLARFEFSQSSLQDYIDCRRRFQLRYLEHVAWPAAQAEPALENELHIQRGERFHRLAQQYLLGVPEERLTRMAEADSDPHLRAWWANFIECIPSELSGRRHVEVSLSAPLGNHRLVAKYDLVLIRPDGKAVIYDWKTSIRRPKKQWILQRMQTRVYPYLLVQAGAALNNNCAFEPDQIEMIYWYAGPQQPPEVLPYSLQNCQDDGSYLLGLVNQLAALGPDDFAMATSEQACRFCVYRSLCDRGTRAGDLSTDIDAGDGDSPAPEYQSDIASGLDFNLEQIGEISF